MRFFITVLSLLLSATFACALVVRSAAPSPSATPCVWKCPAKDTAGHALDKESDSTSTINCQYGGVDSFCQYNKTTGALTSDHDGYKCPATAVKTCGSSVRRNALPQSPRQRFVRQADSTELETRNQLGAAKRKRNAVQA